jgi:Cu(I)/Ag(I) efflux system membrane protein CusA/SilA
VNKARKVVTDEVELPPGYYIEWAGQYQYLLRVKERLKFIVPVTIFIIFMLLYINFRSVTETLIVLFSVPFSLVGSVWLLYLLGFNMSIAVWVGIIALAGLAAETGVVMIIYLDEAYERRVRENAMNSPGDLKAAIIEGAAERVRPKVMTVGTTLLGLLPLMWSTGTGADMIKRIAAPMVGGLITSTILTLLIIPVIYALWKGRGLSKKSNEYAS